MSDVILDLESEIVALEQLLELKRARLAMEKSRWKPKRPLDGTRMPYATRTEASPIRAFKKAEAMLEIAQTIYASGRTVKIAGGKQSWFRRLWNKLKS